MSKIRRSCFGQWGTDYAPWGHILDINAHYRRTKLPSGPQNASLPGCVSALWSRKNFCFECLVVKKHLLKLLWIHRKICCFLFIYLWVYSVIKLKGPCTNEKLNMECEEFKEKTSFSQIFSTNKSPIRCTLFCIWLSPSNGNGRQ